MSELFAFGWTTLRSLPFSVQVAVILVTLSVAGRVIDDARHLWRF